MNIFEKFKREFAISFTLFVCLFLYVNLLLCSGCKQTRTYEMFESVSELKLPAIFSDNMVIQRDRKIPIWGWAKPSERVTVTFCSQQVEAVSDKNGNWIVELGPFSAGGPFEMEISGDKKIILKNVMIGDVWLCSGQSNMEMTVGGAGQVNNYQKEMAEAKYPNIRFFAVAHTKSDIPAKDVTGSGWMECSPQSVEKFSATAYFFGRHIHKHLNVPVGLICSTWGGTPVETWISKDSIKTHPDFKSLIKEMDSKPMDLDEAKKEYEKELSLFAKEIDNKDLGIREGDENWANPFYNDSDWKTMQIPHIWETMGYPNFDGVVWFRKDVDIPSSWAGRDLIISLGAVDDEDISWFNGKMIGKNRIWYISRAYKIPCSIVKPGRNVIAVRVLDTGGNGGMGGEPEQLKLEVKDNKGEKAIPLTGLWKYKVSVNLKSLKISPPINPESKIRPSILYNGMIAPLIPYGIRGVIWYQGESNATRAFQYRRLFQMLIQDWRRHWKGEDFPFLFVQLASFKAVQPEPEEDDWAELREAQTMALSLPNTGMAVTIDIGDAKDVHPKNKQDVGNRLALAARAIAYGENVVYSGPIYKKGSMEIEGNKIRLGFNHTGGGLIVKDGGELKGFAVAGNDKNFYWANAKIEEDTVVVSSEKVKKPVAVRYGWAANPICNFYNKENLPASPFRTDKWKGLTEGNK